MYVVNVKVQVLADRVNEFIAATLENARASRLEAGCAGFDVLRSTEDPLRFALYEVYRDEAAFRAHQETDHYLRWRAAVASMMAAPRSADKFERLGD
jgi:autoinducer 2-degrading protein